MMFNQRKKKFLSLFISFNIIKKLKTENEKLTKEVEVLS